MYRLLAEMKVKKQKTKKTHHDHHSCKEMWNDYNVEKAIDYLQSELSVMCYRSLRM